MNDDRAAGMVAVGILAYLFGVVTAASFAQEGCPPCPVCLVCPAPITQERSQAIQKALDAIKQAEQLAPQPQPQP